MAHLYLLDDDQVAILKTLVCNRMHSEIEDLVNREPNDSLDYVDFANMVKDLGNVLEALRESYDGKITAKMDVTPESEPEKKKDPDIETPCEPQPEPCMNEKDPSCRTCGHCVERTGNGRGRRFKCGLSGAWFGPGLGCEAWAEVGK